MVALRASGPHSQAARLLPEVPQWTDVPKGSWSLTLPDQPILGLQEHPTDQGVPRSLDPSVLQCGCHHPWKTPNLPDHPFCPQRPKISGPTGAPHLSPTTIMWVSVPHNRTHLTSPTFLWSPAFPLPPIPSAGPKPCLLRPSPPAPEHLLVAPACCQIGGCPSVC